MARVLRPIRSGLHEKIPTEILSTEEALYHIHQFNNKIVANQRRQQDRVVKVPNIQTDDITIGSMDVTALYPNCKVDSTCKVIEESIINSGLIFDQINLEFLTRFVSVLFKGVIKNKSLQNFLQIPKPRTTLNSFMKSQDNSKFQGPAMKPSGDLSHDQVRELVSLVAAKSTHIVMDNHFYQIGGKLFKQSEGSAIGVDLSVETCSLYMTCWDDKFLRKLKRLGISVDMYFRYVDDIVMGIKGIHPAWSFSKRMGRMIFDPNNVSDKPDDQHTFEQLQLIANTLDPNIQMTVDTPSQCQGGFLPVLDLALNVSQNQIKHKFYSKPMSSPYQIHYRSAIAKRTKRETLLQEGIRRLRNTSADTNELEKINNMSEYMNSLRVSGYDLKYRYNLLKGIQQLYDSQECDIALGVRDRFRSREQILAAKEQKIGKYPATWFLRGKNQNTLKVQATPDSALLRAMNSALGDKVCTEGGATKFVELGGKPVTTGLSGSVKFTANSGCIFPRKCNIDPEFDCRVARSVYCVECMDCSVDPTKQKTVYYGTSGRQMHLRQLEHLKDIQNRRRSNALFKHASNEHNGNAIFRSQPILGGFRLKHEVGEELFGSPGGYGSRELS